MKLKYFHPLLILMIPHLIITTCVFVFDHVPQLLHLIGFTIFNIFVCVNYYLGIKAVVKDLKQEKFNSDLGL
jgi:hypothetical protein